VTSTPAPTGDRRLGLLFVAPALLVMVAVALLPIAATAWEALHRHDLRLPWLGRPFIGVDNFIEAAGDPRLRSALLHTLGFAAVSVPIELAGGVALAVLIHRRAWYRPIARVVALLPWALPTVVAALVWRFMFEAQTGILMTTLQDAGFGADWFADPWLAWIPVVATDVWKTTPFVALLVLAGLQTIDPLLYEAARVDGAGPVRQFATITLPLIRPSLLVAGAFRALDALRIFDIPYVLTGGGPGTATEPLSLYAFIAVMQRLRFGYGAALAVIVFALTLALALLCARALARGLETSP
jgi:ABC-type sugar transport system permease subunit